MTKPIPPMMPGLPFLGNVLDFRKDRTALVQRGYETYGPVFGFKLATQPVAALIGPELHQVFFTETDKKLAMDKPYRSLAAAIGNVAFLASPRHIRSSGRSCMRLSPTRKWCSTFASCRMLSKPGWMAWEKPAWSISRQKSAGWCKMWPVMP